MLTEKRGLALEVAHLAEDADAIAETLLRFAETIRGGDVAGFHDDYVRQGGTDPLNRVLFTDLSLALPTDMLVKVDQASMLLSLAFEAKPRFSRIASRARSPSRSGGGSSITEAKRSERSSTSSGASATQPNDSTPAVSPPRTVTSTRSIMIDRLRARGREVRSTMNHATVRSMQRSGGAVRASQRLAGEVDR